MKLRNASIIPQSESMIPIFVMLVTFFALTFAAVAQETVEYVGELKTGLIEPVDVAVNELGEIFVLDREASMVTAFNKEGEKLWSFGEVGKKQGEMQRPDSLAISQAGDLIVGDTGNSRVQVFSKRGDFLYELGQAGQLPGQFISPSKVAVDQWGNIFVGDTSKNVITKFSPHGVFLNEQKMSNTPDEIIFDLEQNMYVLMTQRDQLVKWSKDQELVKAFTLNHKKNWAKDAIAMDVDMHGDIYIIEKDKNTIMKFNQDEELLFSFGSKGSARGQFKDPTSLVSDMEGNIYVADAKNGRVQILNVKGSEKESLVKAENVDPHVDFDMAILAQKKIVDLILIHNKGLYALSDDDGHILFRGAQEYLLGETDQKAQKLSAPKGLFADNDGQILVADTGNNQLKFLNDEGEYVYQFGEKGDDHGQFNGLEGVVQDEEGFIYVADTINNRIQVFNKDGIYLRSFGKKSVLNEKGLPVKGHFLNPKDLVFDSQGMLYVLDYGNKRIQVLSKNGAFIKDIGTEADVMVDLKDPVDIAIDEHDYLYVADRGDHKIKIIDPEGNMVLDFGSSGKGPSYFPELTGVDAFDGKIYVADYRVDEIKVFNFNHGLKQNSLVHSSQEKSELAQKQEVEEKQMMSVDKSMKEEMDKDMAAENEMDHDVSEDVAKEDQEQLAEDRVLFTQVSYPLNSSSGQSEESRYELSKKMTLQLAKQQISNKFNISLEMLDELIVIEKEEILDNGQLKLTLSLPKNIMKYATQISQNIQ